MFPLTADGPVQERDHTLDALGREKQISAVRRAMDDVQRDVEAGLLVGALQLVGLIDRHLRVLVAMHEEQRWIARADVDDRARHLREAGYVLRQRPQ